MYLGGNLRFLREKQWKRAVVRKEPHINTDESTGWECSGGEI